MTRVAFIGESEDLHLAVDRTLVVDALFGGLMPGHVPGSPEDGAWLVRKLTAPDGRPVCIEAHCYVPGENPHEGEVRAIHCANIAYIEGVDE